MIVKDFDLGLTTMSGQPLTFHSDYLKKGKKEVVAYSTLDGRMEVVASGSTQRNNVTYSYSGEYTEQSAKREVTSRFALGDNLEKIYKKINTDPFMDNAICELWGLRVTKNDPWETTICFVISQFNNIKRIRGIIKNLSETFGEEIEANGSTFKTFPTAATLANADVASIRKCGTGFRDKYIKRVAEECVSRVDLDELYDLDYQTAKERLLLLDGIGDKVADCILLFGYRKLEAFPIDVWIKRVVETAYFKGRKKSIKEIHRFADKKWENLSGYANQYIFHQGRVNKIGK